MTFKGYILLKRPCALHVFPDNYAVIIACVYVVCDSLVHHYHLSLCFLVVDGAVYAWGLGKGCGLARGDVLEPRSVPLRSKVRLVQVAAGQSHSLALTGE